MKKGIFCEIVFNEIMPTVRAIIANRLINAYGLTQQEVAEKLGLTQPAVSHYKNRLRGKNFEKILSKKVMVSYIDSLSAEIVSKNIDPNLKVCEICKKSKESGIFSKEEIDSFICIIEVAKSNAV